MAVLACAPPPVRRHRRGGSAPPVRGLTAALVATLVATACGTTDPTDAADPAGAATAIEVDNCGIDVGFDVPPQRIVGLNSGAVEVLLALGVEDRIVGAVGREESIQPRLRAGFDRLPLLDSGSEDYPSSEVILELEPELIYSVYPSAFRDTGIASRQELADLGVATYLAPGRCPDRDATTPLSVEEIWTEIEQVGALVDADEAAAALIDDQRAALAAVRDGLPNLGELEVFWWDVGTDDPLAGACCGAPGMILRELGLTNVFDDLDDHWSSVSWEQVVERDPDVIVMVDFGEGDIADKRDFIADDPTLRELRAFRDDAVVVLPFSQTTPGLQNVDAIEALAQQLADLDADR